MEKPLTPTDDGRKSRSDGVQSRERLLLTAMRLFAEQGFARTSTREIALAAGTNIASISYYFGDKAGLYRAAFMEPAPHASQDMLAFTAAGLSLRESLLLFYNQMLAPLKQGDLSRLCMRLWFREMLEPTGLWHEEIDNGIRPAHEGLMLVLARHLELEQEDDDLSRLAFCVVGLCVQLMVARDVIDKISPHLLDSDDAINTWFARMTDHAEAMIAADKVRRNAAAALPVDAASTPPSRKKKA